MIMERQDEALNQLIGYIEMGDEDNAQQLLKSNAVDPCSYVEGCYPLLSYVLQRKTPSLMLANELMRMGADIEQLEETGRYGVTPLMRQFLQWPRNETSIEWLVLQGANANVVSPRGRTILDVFIPDDFVKALEWVERGASLRRFQRGANMGKFFPASQVVFQSALQGYQQIRFSLKRKKWPKSTVETIMQFVCKEDHVQMAFKEIMKTEIPSDGDRD